MKRREFLKLAAVSGAGLSLSGGIVGLAEQSEGADRPDLAVVTGTSPSAITRAAVEAMGGIRSFVSKGDTVVVKPNIGWDRTPEQAANTNPEVVAEVGRIKRVNGRTLSVFTALTVTMPVPGTRSPSGPAERGARPLWTLEEGG